MNNELCNFLSNVPNERQRSYELSLTDYVLKNNSAQTINDLTQIADKHPNQQIAYNAFYCLNIIFRRAKDYFKVNNLFEKYTQRFSKHITFEHLKVLFEIESGSMYDYDEMLNVTYKDSELFFDNAGFVHLFADVFATIYENGYIHNMDAFLDGWYQLALNAANKAIELEQAAGEGGRINIDKIKELATEVASEALQVFGGIGYTEQTRVSRIWQDCRGNQIAWGTDEVMAGVVAKAAVRKAGERRW